MTIIKITPHANGGHDNQTINGATPETFHVPEGYAIVPEEVGTPETLTNYPFGDITVEDRGGIPTVTSWTPLPIPEPEPVPYVPTTEDRLEAVEAAMLALLEV